MSSPPKHSVESHLRLSVDSYDAQIRRFVPHYEEMLAAGVEVLAALAPPALAVLDLGAGTGALSAAVLAAVPGSRAAVLDVDPDMLAQARLRLAPYGERASFHEASYFGALPPADAIVASLSLHHVHELEKKTALYAAIHRALPPGGVFLSLDATVSADSALAARTYEGWVAWMGAAGIGPEEARGHLAAWAKEDRYLPLHVELAALAHAGFSEPECFWRRGSQAVFGGVR